MSRSNGPVRIIKAGKSKKNGPATEGLEWLEHSIAAFNGSGYAEYDDGEAFLNSYVVYKHWKNKPDHAALAKQYYNAILPLCEHIVATSAGAGRVPTDKNWAKWVSFREKFVQLPQTSLL